MGMLDDLLGAALGGQGTGGRAPQGGGTGLPAGLDGASIAALLPVLMSMLNQGQGASGGGLGGLLGQVLGGAGGSGPAGGLGGLLNQIESAGFGDHAKSWVGTGQNLPIPPDAIGRIFGNGGLADIAKQAGLSTSDASAGLAQLLPAVVDRLTPNGQLPAGPDLASALGGLLGRLGR